MEMNDIFKAQQIPRTRASGKILTIDPTLVQTVEILESVPEGVEVDENDQRINLATHI